MSNQPKQRPNYTGIIQAKDNDKYVDYGKIALWEQTNGNPNAPCFKGTITIGTTKYTVSIWKRTEATTQ